MPKGERWLTPDEADRYGFRWGQVDVTRACSHKGNRLLQIVTDRQVLEVWVTPTGLVRPGKPRRNEHTTKEARRAPR